MARALTLGDKITAQYAKDLSKVLYDLEKRVSSIVRGASANGLVDAAILLNSRPAMLQALRESGYTALAQEHINAYPGLVGDIKTKLAGVKGFPAPVVTEASAATFSGLARIDLEQFAKIGEQGLDELRLSLYRQAVGNTPFESMVDSIKAATVGIDGKGSPMANHAYAHANTAVLQFQGEVIREIGEELGADLWEVVGPSDGATRAECQAALSDPIRTAKEWTASGYWGGSPGGWNCRHQLMPVFA